MIRQLAVHTFKNHLMTLRFSIGLAMAVIMVVAVTLVQLQDLEARAEAATQYDRARLDYKEGTTAWSMVRTVMEERPSNLAFMAKGISGWAPNLIEISAGIPATLTEMQSYHASNPLLDFLPDQDVSGIVAFFFSFLAILLSYDMISGSREQGMLRALLAAGVGRIKLITGLALGGLATLMLIVLLSFGALAATLQWFGPVGLGAEVLPGLLIIAFEVLLYCTLFYAIGLLCSCLCRRSNLSLLFALLAWVVLVIALPSLATQLVVQLDPLPTSAELEKSSEEIDREFRKNVEEFWRQNDPQEGYYGWNTGNIFGTGVRNTHYIVRSPYDSLIEFRRNLRDHIEPMRERALARIEQMQLEYENRMWRQAAEIDLLNCLSPAAVLRRACAVASRTDPATLRDFIDSAHELRRGYVDFQRSKGYGSLDFTTDQHRNRGRLDISGLPPLPKQEWSATDVLVRSGGDIALLVAPMIVLLLAVGFIFVRYDVR